MTTLGPLSRVGGLGGHGGEGQGEGQQATGMAVVIGRRGGDSEVAWLQVFEGQGLKPAQAHPLAALIDEAETEAYLRSVESVIAKCVAVMPTHEDYIAAHCKAAPVSARA